MRRIELELEHRYKNRFVGRHRFKPGGEPIVIGSVREAQIRLLGDEVSGVHAVLEFDQDWVLSDVGSEKGTWIQKKPIVEHSIKGATSVQIGAHRLRLIPHVIENDLFQNDTTPEAVDNAETYHQVVIKKNGLVVESHLLGPRETFYYLHGKDRHELTPPKQKGWKKTELGDVLVQQRVVPVMHLRQTGFEKIAGLVDPSLKRPFGVAAIILFLLSALMLFAPSQPEDDLEMLKPETNRYTRIIYDSKASKQRRMQAKRQSKRISSRQPASAEPQKAQNVAKAKATGATPKVVSRIKAAGLSKLIGKISKRASRTARHIASVGAAPDTPSGPALARVGSVANAKGKGGTGKSYKIAGVGTSGKAGGSSSYKGIGGLAAGGVGNASVGVLEEETEVQGGLERDVIARVIQSNIGQIRYCYERQLSASPDLYGKVMVKFTIGASGSVTTQKVGLTTLKNAMVEGCILRRVAGWRFPKPKGGTSVLVSYPFLLKSTN